MSRAWSVVPAAILGMACAALAGTITGPPRGLAHTLAVVEMSLRWEGFIVI